MNRFKRLTISSAAVLLFSSVAVAVPVSARDGNNVAEADNTTTTSTTNDSSGSDQSGSSLAEQFRELAQQKNQQAKLNHQEQTQAQREKVCEIHKTNLTRRMGNAVKVAEQHKTNIDRIYTKVKDFYTSKQLNVTNYSDLTAKVDTAQTNAQTAIDALKALDVNVDCTSQTVADSVTAFQQAVTNVRDSLKTYRSALVDLITALKGASTSSNSGTSTDNTNTSGQ
ncbi:MAG TPA: hypothetical protein VFH37_01990 [Candidatus Saccharimonadales bacterium]|nr:hypothetical protein [Candidatus Saccharimonadales bacterium]